MKEWEYLRIIAGNLVELIQFYITTWAPYHVAMREAAIAIIFPGGIAWIGFMMLKYPADRFKSAVGTAILLGCLGVLLAPSSKSSSLYVGQSAAGYPLANGTYWSWAVIGNFYKLFKSSIDSVGSSVLAEQAGNGGASQADRMLIMFDDTGSKMAANLEGTDAQRLVNDYVQKCTRALKNNLHDDATIEKMRGVGLANSTLLGISEAEANSIKSAYTNYLNGAKEYFGNAVNLITPGADYDGWGLVPAFGAASFGQGLVSGATVSKLQADGKALLASIPEADDPFLGGTNPDLGYSIPTKAHHQKALGIKTNQPEYLDAATEDNGKYLRPIEDKTQSFAEGENKKFYPKNCLEAYELANKALLEFRNAAKDQPGYIGKPIVQTAASSTAVNSVMDKVNRENAMKIAAVGGTPVDGDNSLEKTADAMYGLGNEVSGRISEWLLRYKVPMMVSGSAMLAAFLLLGFPLFAAMAIFIGPQLLFTYLKMLTFAFLIVLLNDLFLMMASDLFTMNKLADGTRFHTDLTNNFTHDMASMSAKAIVFSCLTVVEIAVAKLLIWDDVKALGSFNPGQVGLDRAVAGAKVVGGAALTVATLGKGALVAGVAAKGAALAASKAGASKLGAAGMAARAVATSPSVRHYAMSSARHGMNTAGHAGNAGIGSSAFRPISSNFVPPKPKPPKKDNDDGAGPAMPS